MAHQLDIMKNVLQENIPIFYNKKAMLSQGESRDATVN